MSYPTLEKYNEALQHPQVAFSDPDLANGKVTVNGFGLPVAMCGGFALTYGITNGRGKKFAVRCFHKQSNSLEKRYDAISRRLRGLNSPFFLDFDFQHSGIRIAGAQYPIVKMEWASGVTLGEYLERYHTSPDSLRALGISLADLAAFLESNRIAHGDIQPENVMATGPGGRLQLIDYDGMYVDELAQSGASELGQKNFQHPQRGNGDWGPNLDRFSFILLHVALKSLNVEPSLWGQTQSDGGAVLFRAHDLANPGNSAVFARLLERQGVGEDVRNLARVCDATCGAVPCLGDFMAGRNIPASIIRAAGAQKSPVYVGAYQVLSANDYFGCERHVGDVVELIGQITAVKASNTKYGKPYVFLNFGDWRDDIVKITIWSEGLATLSDQPNGSWVGRWVSVVGLMDPPYVTNSYSHLSITITKSNQIRHVTSEQAMFRLGKAGGTRGGPSITNREIADRIAGRERTPESSNAARGATARVSPVGGHTAQSSSISRNQEIAKAMAGGGGGSGRSSPSTGGTPSKSTGGGTGCLVLVGFFVLIIILAAINGL
jgi:hypothetical protein